MRVFDYVTKEVVGVWLFLLTVAVVMLFWQFAPKEKAWIYQHKELGTFLYCDADQNPVEQDTKDYTFAGTGLFDSVSRCSLAL